MSYLASVTDLTSTLSSILVEVHKADPIDPHVTFKTLDSFLLEAKQIVRGDHPKDHDHDLTTP